MCFKATPHTPATTHLQDALGELRLLRHDLEIFGVGIAVHSEVRLERAQLVVLERRPDSLLTRATRRHHQAVGRHRQRLIAVATCQPTNTGRMMSSA